MACQTLQSWKEIAQYVGRGVRTVQRWETFYGFPVHRPAGRPRAAVYALEHEIDAWLASSGNFGLTAALEDGAPSVEKIRERLQLLEAECVRLRRALQMIVSSQNGDLREVQPIRPRAA